MKLWYKDRDFPEIKAGNDDIVAVVEDELQLKRIVAEHNELVEEIAALKKRVQELEDSENLKEEIINNSNQRYSIGG